MPYLHPFSIAYIIGVLNGILRLKKAGGFPWVPLTFDYEIHVVEMPKLNPTGRFEASWKHGAIPRDG